MVMPVPPPLVPDTARRDWTAEELALLPDDGNRYEIVDGELLVTPAPAPVHQRAALRLASILLPYCDAHGIECVIAPADVAFSRSTVVEPDLFVVPLRADGSLVRDYREAGRLLLAVEVLSPSSVRADRVVKRIAYLAAGVPDYWIVDTAHRCVERWRPGHEVPEMLVESLTWQPQQDAPPLVIDLPKYFRLVHGERVPGN
jgi:Uma2 family endonuclease